jgi:hypothetical protein
MEIDDAEDGGALSLDRERANAEDRNAVVRIRGKIFIWPPQEEHEVS